MNQHTPGPWDHLFDKERIVGANDEVVVYEVNANPADIRLIVAAPDLLAVLRRMIDHGRRCNWFADRGDEELVAEAEEIIDKVLKD